MIETTKVPLGQLRTRREFQALVVQIQQVLDEERQLYENSPASEYRRGRVNVLRDLLDDLTGASR